VTPGLTQVPLGGTQAFAPLDSSANAMFDEQLASFSGVRLRLHSLFAAQTRKQ
jgi:hypothetical protein